MIDEERQKLCAKLRSMYDDWWCDCDREPCDAAADEIERLNKAWKEWYSIAERLQDDLRTGKRTCDFSFLGEDFINVDNTATFAQSNAEPVAWQWRMPNQNWPELSCGKAHAEYMRDKGAEIRPVFAAPSTEPSLNEDAVDAAFDKFMEGQESGNQRPVFYAGVEFGLRHAAPPRTDASAGLIEAAEITREWAGATSSLVEAHLLDALARELRARAADRSGK